MDADGSAQIKWVDQPTGSYVVYDSDLGGSIELVIGAGAPPNARELFDQLLDSIKEDTPPMLTALAGGGAGEILLEWTIGTVGATRWQYRQWRPVDTAWGAWTDIPGSDAGTTSHRLTGLPPDEGSVFQVRPWTAQGPGAAYAQVQGYALRAGVDGIPIALGQVLEDGRTYRVGETQYTFTTPRGLQVAVMEWVPVSRRNDPDQVGGARERLLHDLRQRPWRGCRSSHLRARRVGAVRRAHRVYRGGAAPLRLPLAVAWWRGRV